MYHQFHDIYQAEQQEIKYDILRETFRELKVNRALKINCRYFRQQKQLKIMKNTF
jgi:hypothetical protein